MRRLATRRFASHFACCVSSAASSPKACCLLHFARNLHNSPVVFDLRTDGCVPSIAPPRRTHKRVPRTSFAAGSTHALRRSIATRGRMTAHFHERTTRATMETSAVAEDSLSFPYFWFFFFPSPSPSHNILFNDTDTLLDPVMHSLRRIRRRRRRRRRRSRALSVS